MCGKCSATSLLEQNMTYLQVGLDFNIYINITLTSKRRQLKLFMCCVEEQEINAFVISLTRHVTDLPMALDGKCISLSLFSENKQTAVQSFSV